MDMELHQKILDNIYDGVYFVDRDRKITYWNKGAERITGYKSTEVIGLRCSDNLLMHIDSEGNLLCFGLCPLAMTIGDGTLREAEIYLHHKDGHRVPVFVRVAPIRDPDGQIIGAVEIFNDNSTHIDLVKQLDQFRELALVDSLTGLANRRYAEMYLRGKFEEMRNSGHPLFGVLFIDIDHFKRVNDLFGHDMGDEVLRMVAMTLKKAVNKGGVVCRWGGEEFIAVVLAKSSDDLYSIAKSLCVLVERSGFNAGPNSISVTVSIGAALAEANDTVDSLIKRADQLMFQSKKLGRNRVSLKLD